MYGSCTCFEGFTAAADCSLRSCPYDYAWTDKATADDTAHAKAECSNRGLCDRVEGECVCMEGFTGKACERSACDFNCYGVGSCVSMRSFASKSYSSLSEQFEYATPWDATKLHGCVCDDPYSSFDCAQRSCPLGDDPLTTGQVNAAQVLKCMAPSGSFVLYFDGKPTGTINAKWQEEHVKAALEEATTIEEVTVAFSVSNGTVCQTDSVNVVTITFVQNFGVLPPLVAFTSDLEGTVTIAAGGPAIQDTKKVKYFSVVGTKEADLCSNRGICDTSTATCVCVETNFDSYSSSDGYGNEGVRGDCGKADTTVSTCPGEIECNSQGVCDPDTFRCACEDGWRGADCSLRTCPSGLSWKSYPSADDVAHDTMAVCSDGGTCDVDTGYCTCGTLFSGAACERLACPGGFLSTCNGHGRCLSMYELALAADENGDATDYVYGSDPNAGETWDARRAYGCECDEGYSGYDCTLRSCPTGDDPGTYDQVQERQILRCDADGGSFALTFRQQQTAAIAWNATASEVELALEQLSTITQLSVAFHPAASAGACSIAETVTIVLDFVTEHGDLPDVTADVSLLVHSLNGAVVGTGTLAVFVDGDATGDDDGDDAVTTSVKGTTEEVECSNRGICDTVSGTCTCFKGYTSSDGAGNMGTQADCGHRSLCTAAWCANYATS